MKKQLLSCSIAAIACMAPTVNAAMLEEVIITAQKREQNLQDVGISVSAFTGEQMEAMGVTQSIDIAAFTPGVHISGNLAGQNTQFSIRGVTQNDFNDIIEAPNAVYLDEGYLAIAQAQTFAVFDIDRVEILKGPQGTLFGRNATGGLVHYVSTKPTFETEGYVKVGMGRYDTDADADELTIEAAVGGALSDTVAARIAVRSNQRDGYLKNLYPESAFGDSPGAGAGADLGDDDTQAARLSFLFTPSDKLNISLSANYASSEVATGPYQSKSTIGILNDDGELINVINTPADETRLTIQGDGEGGADIVDGDGFYPAGVPPMPDFGVSLDDGRLVPGGDFFGYIDADGDDMTFSSDFAFEDQGSTDTTGLNLKFDYELANGMQLVSITDYKDYEKLLFIDVDSAPVNQLANYAGVDATSFSQEFRLSGESDSSRWVAGFFYLNIDNTSDNGLKAPAGSIVNGLDIGTVANLETNSYSVFGQMEYDISDRLMATVGLRVIKEEKDFDVGIGVFPSFGNFSVNQGDFIPNVFGAGSPYFYDEKTSDTLWTGKAQLDYRPNDDLLLYAGINRGVKAGSFNAPLLGAFLGAGGFPSLPYDEEILLSYEAGFKQSFGDGSTRLNGSFFYYDYSDYQAFMFVGVAGVVVNADAENYGMELELQTSPMQGLDAMFSIAVFDATVEDILLRNGSPLPARDVKPTYAPELQATALVRYEWPSMGGMMAVQGDVSYSDEFYYNLRNFDADKFDSYVIGNAQLTWADSSANWQVSLAVRNITDERAGVQGFDLATLCGCNEVAYRDPRSYSISVKREF